MAYLHVLLDALNDQTLEKCMHGEVGDDGFDWSDLVGRLRTIRKIAGRLDATPQDELPDDIRNASTQQANTLVPLVEQIANFNYTTDPNAHNTRNSLDQQIAAAVRDWRTYVPYAHPSIPDAGELAGLREVATQLATRASDLDGGLASVQELVARAESAADRVQAAAGLAASGRLSEHYRSQSGSHKSQANDWLKWAVGVAVILGVASWFAFDGINTSKSQSTFGFARDSIARLLLLGLVAYFLGVCVRGYRANTHLKIVCDQKANALDTFVLFQESVTTDTGKEAVTIELVRAVFATSDSGYLDNSSDRTIIEEQGSAMMSLLAARR
jgi:hypothetical protein